MLLGFNSGNIDSARLSISLLWVVAIRARFTAYAKGLPQFVVDSTHPDCPLEVEFKQEDGSYGPGFLEEATKFCEDYEFSKLSIIQSTVDEEAGEAKVLFKVRCSPRHQPPLPQYYKSKTSALEHASCVWGNHLQSEKVLPWQIQHASSRMHLKISKLLHINACRCGTG